MNKSKSNLVKDNDLPLTKEICATLKNSREELGLSREEFSVETGVAEDTLYNLENKRLKHFNGNHLKKIVKFLKGHKGNTKISNFFSAVDKNDNKSHYKSLVKGDLRTGRKDGVLISNCLKNTIKNARINANISQISIAKKMGTSLVTYVKLENTNMSGTVCERTLINFVKVASSLFSHLDYKQIISNSTFKKMNKRTLEVAKSDNKYDIKISILNTLSEISNQILNLTKTFNSLEKK